MYNIPDKIISNLHRELYKDNKHPLGIVKNKIFEYFDKFNLYEIDNAKVSVDENFDSLLIPKEHPSRSTSDTFYFDKENVLRTQMTAHLSKLVKHDNYIVCGDVYRKDEIDSTHYPIFHQIDGFSISSNPEIEVRAITSGLLKHLFGNDVKLSILEDKDFLSIYFPFTINSFEIEMEYNGKQLELLGGGTLHPNIQNNLDIGNSWAFGLGLERIAMLLFDIPDIRYFWSNDERFLSQFKENQITRFKPYSRFEVCYKDISFFIYHGYNENEFFQSIRNLDESDLIESVKLIDNFKSKNKESLCYRINYRSMDRTLTNEEVNILQNDIRKMATKFGELR